MPPNHIARDHGRRPGVWLALIGLSGKQALACLRTSTARGFRDGLPDRPLTTQRVRFFGVCRSIKSGWFVLLALLCLGIASSGCREASAERAAPSEPEAGPNQGGGAALFDEHLALSWDSTIKDIYPKPGELQVDCSYEVANRTSQETTITSITPSCGCSVAKTPPLPWTLKPGDQDRLEVVIDLKGKRGLLHKAIQVQSSFGLETVFFKVHIPDIPAETRATRTMRERLDNMKIAAADRQAVFKNDCRSCHFEPALGRKDESLFQAACGVCHDTPHRASMVPDLAAHEGPRDVDYWRTWIAQGKEGTLMPAFREQDGGPLTDEQIENLAHYLSERFVSNPAR